MGNSLVSQLESLDAEKLQGLVDAAMIVACADGALEEDEINQMYNAIVEVTGDTLDEDSVMTYINDSLERFNEGGFEALGNDIHSVLDGDEDLQRVAFLFAASTAWKSGGIDADEGTVLQQLKELLGIGQNEYFQLLGEAKSLGAALTLSIPTKNPPDRTVDHGGFSLLSSFAYPESFVYFCGTLPIHSTFSLNIQLFPFVGKRTSDCKLSG
jgi:tellurite resistance protein